MMIKTALSLLLLLCSLGISEIDILVVVSSIMLSSYFYYLLFGTTVGTYDCTICADATKEAKSMPLDVISDIVISFGFLHAIYVIKHPFVLGYILPCAVMSILISIVCLLVYYDYIELPNEESDNT